MGRVQRTIIGVFGRINAGKSTCMNLLTQQETSLVDSTPGTTADIKSALMEIHGLGPCKVLDTAGLDEGARLGDKKKRKTLDALEEVDLAVLVIDPEQVLASEPLEVESLVAVEARRLGKPLAVVWNVHDGAQERLGTVGTDLDGACSHAARALPERASIPELRCDLSDPANSGALAGFLVEAAPEGGPAVPLLPFVGSEGTVVLHVPMDEESPSGRLLRPQEMAVEALLRTGAPVALYRSDLGRGRSASADIAGAERDRFLRFLEAQRAVGPVQLVLTDAQAVDLMDRWVPADVPLTTFSVMMIHHSSGGRLGLFADGARALDALEAGDRVLIVEACNHDRIGEDIGTVQIPRKLQTLVPGVEVDHAFGREFPTPERLRGYAVAIHCGGCMIQPAKLGSRVSRLAEAGVPVTNYGLTLAWCEGPTTLRRVLDPWSK